MCSKCEQLRTFPPPGYTTISHMDCCNRHRRHSASCPLRPGRMVRQCKLCLEQGLESPGDAVTNQHLRCCHRHGSHAENCFARFSTSRKRKKNVGHSPDRPMKVRRSCECGRKFHSVSALKDHVAESCPANQPPQIPRITPEAILRSAREMQEHYDLPEHQRVCCVCDEVQPPNSLTEVSANFRLCFFNTIFGKILKKCLTFFSKKTWTKYFFCKYFLFFI